MSQFSSFFDVDSLLSTRTWATRGGDAVALPYLDDGTVDMGEGVMCEALHVTL